MLYILLWWWWWWWCLLGVILWWSVLIYSFYFFFFLVDPLQPHLLLLKLIFPEWLLTALRKHLWTSSIQLWMNCTEVAEEFFKSDKKVAAILPHLRRFIFRCTKACACWKSGWKYKCRKEGPTPKPSYLLVFFRGKKHLIKTQFELLWTFLWTVLEESRTSIPPKNKLEALIYSSDSAKVCAGGFVLHIGEARIKIKYNIFLNCCLFAKLSLVNGISIVSWLSHFSVVVS